MSYNPDRIFLLFTAPVLFLFLLGMIVAIWREIPEMIKNLTSTPDENYEECYIQNNRK